MLSTKNMKSGGGNLRPVIDAGNNKIRINDLTFDQTPYDKEAYQITMHVETEPVGGEFQGFLKDKENPNGPRYEGQVGRVRFSQYAYRDAVLPSGIEIKRDQSVLKAMVILSETLGLRDELDNIEADTIFEFMAACRQIFKNSKFFNACIGGREWENKDGYVNLDLFLPRADKGKVVIEDIDAANSRLMKFNADKHIKRLAKKTVSSFEDDDNPFASEDFDL